MHSWLVVASWCYLPWLGSVLVMIILPIESPHIDSSGAYGTTEVLSSAIEGHLIWVVGWEHRVKALDHDLGLALG